MQRRLKIASYLYHWGFAHVVVLTGKYNMKKMAQLMQDIVPIQALICENGFPDPAETASRLKKHIFVPNKFKNALIIGADDNIEQTKEALTKTFGENYFFDFYSTQEK